MKVLELFAGTRSLGKAFEAKGHEVLSIDLKAEISELDATIILIKFGHPDVILVSPDHVTFSLAAISHHRKMNLVTKELEATSAYAKFCDKIDQLCLDLINKLNPKFWFIENPVGAMCKVSWMQGLPIYYTTYCRYGSKQMRPTNIWTNHIDPKFEPPCKNGDPCHTRAPRGSKAVMHTAAPEKLCQHIVNICEAYYDKQPDGLTPAYYKAQNATIKINNIHRWF